MKHILYVSLILLLIGCEQTAPQKAKKAKDTKSRYEQLLVKYQSISFDTLMVFPEGDVDNIKYKYKGTQLDSTEVTLLPKEIAYHYVFDPGFFACYKFLIDSSNIGLITRTPSMSRPSSVKLFILNKEKDSITSHIELAESMGDAGDMLNKTSWIFKGNNNTWNSFMWVQEGQDDSEENPDDTTTGLLNYYFLLAISDNKIDTIDKDEKGLKKRYGNLLNQ